MDLCTKINRLFLLCTSIGLFACAGNTPAGNANGQTTDPNQQAVAPKLSLETTALEDVFKQAQPLQLTENEEVVTGTAPIPEGTKVFKMQKTTDFEDYLGKLKDTGKIRYRAWDMNDLLYGEFLDQQLDKPISDNSIVQRNLLTAKELKYFKLWFILSLKENTNSPKEAYDKVFGKLNDICKDCIPLEQPQVDKLQQKIKEMPDNYGVFDIMSAQQMTSYGL